MDLLFITFCVAILPFIRNWSMENFRTLILVLAAGLYMVWFLMGENLLHIGSAGISLAVFLMYMGAACAWSKCFRQSLFDFLYWLGLGCIFFVAGSVDLPYIAAMVLIPGVVSAVMIIIQRYKKNKPQGLLKNSNHSAGHLNLSVFCGLWLSMNFSMLFFPVTILCGAALGFSRSRGALTGLFFGLCLYCFSLAQAGPGTVCTGLVFVMPFLCFGKKWKQSISSIRERIGMYITCLVLIVRKPFFGWGPGTYRREQFEGAARIMKQFPGFWKKHQLPMPTTHRVHNEFLETAFEGGLIGLALFLFFLFSLPIFDWETFGVSGGLEKSLAAGLVAVLIHSIFFFPLREAHTGAAFFAIAGSLAAKDEMSSLAVTFGFGGDITSGLNHTLGKWVLVSVIAGVVYSVVKPRLVGLYWWAKASKTKTKKHQNYCIRKAIEADPHNGRYLSQGYCSHVIDSPHYALICARTMVEHFDGRKVLWGLCDQYARALVRMGAVVPAITMLKRSLWFNPDYAPSKELLLELEMRKKNPRHELLQKNNPESKPEAKQANVKELYKIVKPQEQRRSQWHRKLT